MSVRIQEADFDQSAEIEAITARNHEIGAVVSFVGLVRGGDVSEMTLEHYPGMTERALEEIEQQAAQRWELDDTLIIHRIGSLGPGDKIVLVAAASRHRRNAFEAAEFIMDYLKTKAPFWKKETKNGKGSWVDARESDESAAQRWASEE